MPAALSPPQIDGFDDVESFAAEHGLTDTLFAAYEILDRLYSTTQSIRVELYDDPEDPDWKPIFFVVMGHEEFCEVFFDNVRVPADGLLGEANKGWSIAKSLLGFERIALGSPKLCEYGLQLLTRIAHATGNAGDPVFRDKFTALQLDVAHLADAYAGFADILVRGEPIGQDVSLLKIWSTETFQRIAELGIETAGAAGALTGRVALGREELDVLGSWYKARPATIYGGSNEIQRNIIARQVLDLPAR